MSSAREAHNRVGCGANRIGRLVVALALALDACGGVPLASATPTVAGSAAATSSPAQTTQSSPTPAAPAGVWSELRWSQPGLIPDAGTISAVAPWRGGFIGVGQVNDNGRYVGAAFASADGATWSRTSTATTFAAIQCRAHRAREFTCERVGTRRLDLDGWPELAGEFPAHAPRGVRLCAWLVSGAGDRRRHGRSGTAETVAIGRRRALGRGPAPLTQCDHPPARAAGRGHRCVGPRWGSGPSIRRRKNFRSRTTRGLAIRRRSRVECSAGRRDSGGGRRARGIV